MNRSIMIIELLTFHHVGQGSSGEAKVRGYLNGLWELVGIRPVSKPTMHLSKKYGLAAWLPLEDGGAIHLYIWDDRDPAFVSVDVIAFRPIDEQEVISFTRDYFGVPTSDGLVCRGVGPRPSGWRDLAPEIVRQRLMLVADNCSAPSREMITQFLPELARVIDMALLSTIILDRYTAWMHWETSGCVYHWQDTVLSLDIYACKGFSPERAITFTKGFLGLPRINSYSY